METGLQKKEKKVVSRSGLWSGLHSYGNRATKSGLKGWSLIKALFPWKQGYKKVVSGVVLACGFIYMETGLQKKKRKKSGIKGWSLARSSFRWKESYKKVVFEKMSSHLAGLLPWVPLQ